MIERAIPKAPRHLDKATRAWFDHFAGRFEK
ncbi:hypothetical protein FHU13_002270 [Methylobacterium sp. R2-1]|nr:hypothetical protein [Methylobacterium sp. R2-1]